MGIRLLTQLSQAVCAFAMSALVFLSGCASSPTDSKTPEGRAGWSMHGTESVIRRDLEVVNLLYLIDPEHKGKELYTSRVRALGGRDWSDLELSEKYEYGFNAFETRYEHTESTKARLRNMVQERTMAASERRCNHFLIEFRKRNADTNFGLGLATTISAGMGALVPGIRASKNLSGVAGVLSGVRGEFNDAYYANLATSVIIRGIEESRNEARDKLRQQSRQTIGNYSMAAAINDALVFDGLCTVAVGLDKANEALTKVADPGLEAMNRALLKTNVTQLLAQGKYEELGKDLKKLDAAGVDTRWLIPRARTLAGAVGEQGVGVSSFDELSVGDNPQTYVEGLARRAKLRIDDAVAASKKRISRNLPNEMPAGEKTAAQKALAALIDGEALKMTTIAEFSMVGNTLTIATTTNSVSLSETKSLAKATVEVIQDSCVASTTTAEIIKKYQAAQKDLSKARLLGQTKDEQGAKHDLQEADDELRSLSRKFDAHAKAAEDVLDDWLKQIDEVADIKEAQSILTTWPRFAGLLNFKKKLTQPKWDVGDIPKSLRCAP